MLHSKIVWKHGFLMNEISYFGFPKNEISYFGFPKNEISYFGFPKNEISYFTKSFSVLHVLSGGDTPTHPYPPPHPVITESLPHMGPKQVTLPCM